MNYDQLSENYAPRNRIDQSYAYNSVQPKETLRATAEQRQQGSVTREVQQLEKNLQALANVIDSLDIRLAAACLPIPETASGLRTSDGGGCPLANQLSAFNTMLSTQTNRIEMLYQGIDL